MKTWIDPASEMLRRPALKIPQTMNSEWATLSLSFGCMLRNCLDAEIPPPSPKPHSSVAIYWVWSSWILNRDDGSIRLLQHNLSVMFYTNRVFNTLGDNLRSLTRIFNGARAQGDRLHVLFVVSFWILRDSILLTRLYGDKVPLLVAWKITFKQSNFSFNTWHAIMLCGRFPQIDELLKWKMLLLSSLPTGILTVSGNDNPVAQRITNKTTQMV
jgi:hypothetical protein